METDHANAPAASTLASSPPAVRRRKRRGVGVWIAAGWLGLIVLISMLASFLPLASPEQSSANILQGVGWRWPEFLGTDQLGRSQLSRLIFGARVSIVVGLGATAIAFVLGGIIGTIAGYFRGRTERVVDVATDSALAFPALVLLLTVSAIFGQSFRNLVLSLGFVLTPLFIRVARANALTLSAREHVLAARILGARNSRIITREIMPSVAMPLISVTFIAVGAMMVAEGGLSFLGRGIPPPTPSWGGMIAAGRQRMETHRQPVLLPALALFLTVFALNTVGDYLRNRFDVSGRNS